LSDPYWLARPDKRIADSVLCGQKAAGLAQLPKDWVPPYVVLTTSGTTAMGEGKGLPRGRSYKSLTTLLRTAPRGVIVRSSAVGETIAERGAYESSECDSSPAAVERTAQTILVAARKQDPDCEMAIIVQRFEDRHATGHLSNERRVSERPRRWFCEVELPDASERSYRLRADSASRAAKSLRCEDEDSLKRVLREVARRMTSDESRHHLEWLWNGRRLFVVQSDTEARTPGSVPGSNAGLPLTRGTGRRRTRIFHSVPRKLSRFPKIRNVQIFRKAGLPAGHFYILDDSRSLESLGREEVPDDVRHDIDHLVSMPLVIRTDVDASDTADQILRPRTDACLNSQQAIDFLCKTARCLVEEGRDARDFAFIAHHFIPARAGAMARASYPSPLVRVDSTWGFPDGLSYYPHDSFEVDCTDPSKTVTKLRCKYEYMDVSPDGSWQTKRTAIGWDWRSSLTSNELELVAKYARRLSEALGKPIELMLFVGVDPVSGLPPVLPWFSPKEVAPDIDVLPANRLYGGDRQLIADENDLQATRARLSNSTPGDTIQIRLRPKFELLRSKPFLSAVADLAREYDASVELEGSVLGHAFYILAANSVRLRCVEPFVEPERTQRFGKLVRDLIPVRIERHGESPTVYRATPEELRPLLREKLIEEAFEFFWTQTPSAAIGELADIYDLIDALSEVHGADLSAVATAAAEKRAERGGFSEGIVLVETSRRREVRRDDRQLFDGASLTKRTRARPAKRRPSVSDGILSIPLIPSSASPGQWAAVLQLGDGTEIRVRYEESDILVSLSDRPEDAEATGQLKLIDDNEQAAELVD
jgi:predicted house-cleaning noncanonical NTP pyrophosphatase (MazG superfamily)